MRLTGLAIAKNYRFTHFIIHLSISNLLETVLYDYIIMGRAKRIWYLSPMRAAKVQASLRIREPAILHTAQLSMDNTINCIFKTYHSMIIYRNIASNLGTLQ